MNQGKQNISLEPGGQFELSGAPVETLHQTYDEINLHLYQVSLACILVFNYNQIISSFKLLWYASEIAA
jgi:hypothetical protein